MPSSSALATEEVEYVPHIDPIRLSWGILLTAFAIFCTICIASVLLGHFFFFQSSVSLDTTLYVGKGTVSIRVGNDRELAESRFRNLSSETTIRTDSTDLWSQATINFKDPNYEQLIATVSIKGNTTVRLEDAVRPRFNWTVSDYVITLSDVTGEIDILIADGLNRKIVVTILTPNGVEIRLLQSGRYVIDASLSEVSITNRKGQAVIIAPDRTGESVGQGERVSIWGEETTKSLSRTSAPLELLENSTLDTLIPYQDGNAQIINDPPFGWTCTNGPANNLPRGNYYQDIAPDGRASLHLKRLNGATSNGYTRCSQTFLQGLDVTQYDYLALQAVLYINYQSLSGCGVEASECPLMLYVDYTDDDGVNRRWFHGVYARPLPSSSSWKRICDDCVQEHILIYEKTWYIYNSGNWLNLFVEDRRPAKINAIHFYAEGHEYDVFVDEVAILARPIGAEQP
ncbi:MAG: hypothetical protein CUN52_01520 [Phototrophicales bacterium]|nr:MAG: hypothetical protein CUN52_01520 [Phototrophicales bacterium]